MQHIHTVKTILLNFIFCVLNFQSGNELPTWFNDSGLLVDGVFYQNYSIDFRLNPNFLEADFNGDERLDLAIPIKNNRSGKVGFAIIHRNSNEVFIIGAGTEIKHGLGDDMSYIDEWKVNTERINEPGIQGGPALILNRPSLQITKFEVGGGQVYWNGEEYIYFHQTC